MDGDLTVLLAAGIGFAHAFEADHLVAVANLVTRRKRIDLAVKDGVYWGLGHTSTVFLIGVAVLLGRASISEAVFGWLEAGVGVMLVAIGGWRLYWAYRGLGAATEANSSAPADDHGLAYGVGLVHGLAGSGALIALVLAGAPDLRSGLLYLLLFGLGSVGGMLVAAGVLSLPFSRRMTQRPGLQFGLVVASAVLCVGYGAYVVGQQV